MQFKFGCFCLIKFIWPIFLAPDQTIATLVVHVAIIIDQNFLTGFNIFIRIEVKRMLFKTDFIRCIRLIGMVEQHSIPKKNRGMIDAVLKSSNQRLTFAQCACVGRSDMQ